MQVISLKKVTAVVVSCIIGSYIANANDVMPEAKPANAQIIKVKTAMNSFSPLIKEFDLDKDGLLSKAEVTASKHEKLLQHFAEIDLNADHAISDAEFKQFVAQVK
ncbi:hypothetical protein AADZ91_05595 [Colwelliaceae bacterium 6441]